MLTHGPGTTATIFRDHNDIVLAAKCSYLTHATDATTAEELAMKDGQILSNSLGFNNVQAESDSLEVINFCNVHPQWWDSAVLIHPI